MWKFTQQMTSLINEDLCNWKGMLLTCGSISEWRPLKLRQSPPQFPTVFLRRKFDVLSLTCMLLKQEDLHAYATEWRIIKFKDRKQKYCVMHNLKKLANSENIKLLRFGNELYISLSMFIENQQLFYRYQKLRAVNKFVCAGSLTAMSMLKYKNRVRSRRHFTFLI